jgi:hypothetical protein
MHKEEGLELLNRILREKPTDAAESASVRPPRESTASTKCLSLDFLQSKPSDTASPRVTEGLRAAQESAQPQVAGDQIGGAVSGTGHISSSTAATITLEFPKITISAPVEVLTNLLQLLEKLRS